MPLILNGCEGTNENVVIDTTSAGPNAFSFYITEFNPITLDASFRRNPVWRTYGHVSLCLEETVIFETFLNYQFQIFPGVLALGHSNTEDFGLQNYPADSLGNYEIPYVIKWALREGVVMDVYWIT